MDNYIKIVKSWLNLFNLYTKEDYIITMSNSCIATKYNMFPTIGKGGLCMSLNERRNARVIRDYNKFIDTILCNSDYDFSDKHSVIDNHIEYMLNRTQSMFKWNGLPDTIPQRDLEIMLQCGGCVAFYSVDGKLYAFNGGLGGEPNPYYMPTIFTIANPALKLSVNAKIDIDCVVIPSDSMYKGLIPLFNRYAALLAENELSMYVALINSRIPALISSDNDNTTKSAQKYIDDIREGKLGVIASQAFFEGIKTQPYGATSNTNVITNLIESMQYFKASWFNELGLNANYNMKRESINSDESQLNDDALLPLIDDMLRCRKKGVEKVNKMFNTSISVSLASAWEDNQIELNEAQEQIKEEGVKDELPEKVE